MPRLHAEYRGFIPPRAALFFGKKRAVLGVVDFFVVPLAFYLVVNMYWMVWLGLVSSMT